MNASRSDSNVIRCATELGPPLIVLLLPPVVFFIFFTLSRLLQLDEPLGVHPLLVPHSAAGVAAAKIAWGVSLLTYLTAIVVSVYILGSCVVSLTGCARNTAAKLITCIVLFGLIGLLSWLNPNPLSIGSTDYLVRAALNRAGLWQWAHDLGANPGILCAATLIYISALCLWKVNAIDETPGVDDKEAADWLAGRMTILRYGLYAGALVLSAAMIWSNALHGVAAMYVPKDDVESIKQLFSSVTAAQGASWSAFLLSVYAPAALQLRSKAHAVARWEHGDPASAREWLKKSGLLWSVPQQVSTIVGSLAPFFAGLLGLPDSL